MDISIESVKQVRLSQIEEYDIDEEDRDEDTEPYFRTISIETKSGILELEISAASRDALEFIADL